MSAHSGAGGPGRSSRSWEDDPDKNMKKRGGDGQRLAAEVGGGRAGCSSAVPGTGITQKAKKKKRE